MIPYVFSNIPSVILPSSIPLPYRSPPFYTINVPHPHFAHFPLILLYPLVLSLAFFSQLHRPFLLSWIAQLLQAGYSHLRVWSQEPQLSENKHHLSFCVWVSSLDVIFSSSIHVPESFMILFGDS